MTFPTLSHHSKRTLMTRTVNRNNRSFSNLSNLSSGTSLKGGLATTLAWAKAQALAISMR